MADDSAVRGILSTICPCMKTKSRTKGNRKRRYTRGKEETFETIFGSTAPLDTNSEIFGTQSVIIDPFEDPQEDRMSNKDQSTATKL